MAHWLVRVKLAAMVLEPGRMRARLASAAILASLLVPPRRARAAPAEDATFLWDGSDGCPSSADVDARIARRLRDPSKKRAFRAFVVRAEDGIHVRLVASDGGERSLVAPSCEAAAEAVAVIVALASDEEEAAPPREAQPREEPPRERPPREAPTREAPPTTPAWRRAFHLAAALDTASLPQPSPGLALGAEARRGSMAGGLTLRGFLRQTSRLPDRPVEASIGLFEAMVTGCLLLPAARSLDVGGCLAGGAGRFEGSSAGVKNPASGSGWRPQGEALARVGIALTDNVWLRFDGGILVDPVRSPFRIANVGEVHQPAAGTFRGAAGLEVRIR